MQVGPTHAELDVNEWSRQCWVDGRYRGGLRAGEDEDFFFNTTCFCLANDLQQLASNVSFAIFVFV